MAEAGVDRETVYVTNAVKHFKRELRGKRRMHKTPAHARSTPAAWLLEERRRCARR